MEVKLGKSVDYAVTLAIRKIIFKIEGGNEK